MCHEHDANLYWRTLMNITQLKDLSITAVSSGVQAVGESLVAVGGVVHILANNVSTYSDVSDHNRMIDAKDLQNKANGLVVADALSNAVVAQQLAEITAAGTDIAALTALAQSMGKSAAVVSEAFQSLKA